MRKPDEKYDPDERPRLSERALTLRVVAAVAVAMPASVAVYRWLNWEIDALGGPVTRSTGVVASIVLVAAIVALWRTLSPPD